LQKFEFLLQITGFSALSVIPLCQLICTWTEVKFKF